MAQEILNIDTIFRDVVDSFEQTETITSRFLICRDYLDIANELENKDLNVFEVWHFLWKTTKGLQPTTSVLVTCFGTSPSHQILNCGTHYIQ